MSKRMSVAVNVVIVGVLVAIMTVMITTDLNSVFLTVSAPLTGGNRQRPEVGVMIAVHAETDIDEIVTALDEAIGGTASATFFLTGTWISGNLALTQKIGTRFEIGNMTLTGADMRRMSETTKRREIGQAHELIESVTGFAPTLFFPPLGSFTRTTLRTAERLNLTVVLPSGSANIRNGDLVLIDSVAAIESLIESGFSPVSVSETFS